MANRNQERPALNFKPLSSIKVSSTELVFEKLREAILSQTLEAGTPLIEAQLAEMFEVSKTPVREALQRLAQTGLVDFIPGRGASVHVITLKEIQDIFELRLELEPLSLKQSLANLSDNEIKLLEKVLLESITFQQKNDWQRLSQKNRVFHETLVSGADNQLLLEWLKCLSERRQLISLQGWRFENRSLQEWQEHKEILEAVKARDVKLAVKRLEQHIQNFAVLVLKYFPKEPHA